ncbi:hypothetical protein LC040_02925 [Bacillus tianshenii]|nr:hypothetical protein LC040_02925 [Bacillus tianshenii]
MYIQKIVLSLVFLIICSLSFLFYNHHQPPNNNDVFRATKNFFPSTEEVYAVKKVNNEWLTFFRNKNTLFVGKLEQNWLGTWHLINDKGEQGILATAYYPQENEGVTWGASGVGERIAYYFGMVSNPNVEKIIVEAQGKEYQDLPFIGAGGERFFFLKTEGDVVPYSFKALSKDGEIIAPRPPIN